MTGLEKITERILSDARAYEANALEAAGHDAAEIADSYKSRAAFILADSKSRSEKAAESIRLRAASSCEVAGRNILTEAKSTLVDRAYRLAEERLCTMPREEYLSFLTELLTGAVREKLKNEASLQEYYRSGELAAVSEYSVLLNAKDRETLGEALLASASAALSGCGKALTLSEETVSARGGFVLRCADVEIDCTVEMLLRAVRGETEHQVYRTLFGNV